MVAITWAHQEGRLLGVLGPSTAFMISVALGLVYQISQQDLHTTFLNFKTVMEHFFYQYIAKSSLL
jgi:hypothetical protein